jgi:formylglycine-generating enzyme required for sulfatase activity
VVILAVVFTAACGISALGTGEVIDGGADASSALDGEAGIMPGDDGSVSEDGGVDAPIDVHIESAAPDVTRDDAGCPTGRGPTMLRLFGGPSSPALCIDQTEVSSRQYKPFVADFMSGNTPVQSVECTINVSVTPLDMTTLMTPTLDADDPVDRIDECDARLYCEWAGKHLCARRDGTTTLIAAVDANDETVGEWFAACSQDGATSSVPAVANLQANTGIAGRNADQQVLVSADPPGGPTYSGHVLRHIVGNVEEWADGCDATGNCVARGASVKSAGQTDCTTRTTHARMDRKADLGFRCCAKPMP